MTEQQVARSSIPLSPKKQEGQPHGQAQPTMPEDGIVSNRAWRIQPKRPQNYTGDPSSVFPLETFKLGTARLQQITHALVLMMGPAPHPWQEVYPVLGLGAMPNTPYFGCITLCTPKQHSHVLFYTLLSSSANLGKTKTHSLLLSRLSCQISTRQDNKKAKDRGNSLTSILLIVNIGLNKQFYRCPWVVLISRRDTVEDLVRRQDRNNFYLLLHLQVMQGREHLCLSAAKNPLPRA